MKRDAEQVLESNLSNCLFAESMETVFFSDGEDGKGIGLQVHPRNLGLALNEAALMDENF